MHPATENTIEVHDCNSSLFQDLVVFDLETTGLSPQNSEIIQIAAARIQRGEILEKPVFFSYVKPKQKISAFITEYTGITNRDVSRAPRAVDVLTKFSVYCGEAVLIAHNGHRFDIPFLRAACKRRTRRIREVKYIDSMHLSWQVWGRARGKSHSLDNVALRLRIAQEDIRRHDARGDVELTARCIIKLFSRLRQIGDAPKLKVYTGVLPI